MGMYDQLEGMEEILDDFVVETNELIEQLDQDLLLLENGDTDSDLINRVFRAFHTIKGTSGFLGFETCGELAHAAEDVLNTMRNGELDPSSEIVDVLLETVDWFKEFIADVMNREENEYDISDRIRAIKSLLTENGQQEVEKNPDKDNEPAQHSIKIVDIPDELISEFVTEAGEITDQLNNDLLSLEIETDNEELVNNIFRAFHTLKGNSGVMGLRHLSNVAHKAEDILHHIREKKLKPFAEVVDTLLASVDWIKIVLKDVDERKDTTHHSQTISDQLSAILGKQVIAESGKPSTGSSNGKTKVSNAKIPQNFMNQTIRVDVDRLDKLVNLAGELVLEKNRLLQVSRELNQQLTRGNSIDDLDSVNNSLGYITTEIQEGIMQMRMLPIANIFRKFPRMVRDLAREKQKKVELVITGEDTELDRSVIESMGDPLVHLLRNAVDHGIELPEIRKQLGKPDCGTISLSAFQEGNHIVIEIKDDGAGIDADRIAEKAIEKNLITEEEAESMSEKDIINLIFKPGFSTAKVVTDVSGRGVGMDVVHSNIARLNGIVDIKSVKGEGSLFTIKLPLTLTIMNGMVVRVWDEQYIIPLISIIETLKYKQNLTSSVKGHSVLSLRDSILPLFRLDKVLNVPLKEKKNTDDYIVVVSVAEKQIGLIVSELLGQEETVVKPLGRSMGTVPYVAGATIRGDGKINLILDIPEMMQMITA